MKAESLKEVKYSDLFHTDEFSLIAVESFGRSLTFVKELGRRLRYQTGVEKEGTYLI